MGHARAGQHAAGGYHGAMVGFTIVYPTWLIFFFFCLLGFICYVSVRFMFFVFLGVSPG